MEVEEVLTYKDEIPLIQTDLQSENEVVLCHIQTLKKDVQCEEASPLKTTPQGAKQVDNASKQSIDEDEWANLSKTQKKRIKAKGKGKDINKGINSQNRKNLELKTDIEIDIPKPLSDYKESDMDNPFSE